MVTARARHGAGAGGPQRGSTRAGSNPALGMGWGFRLFAIAVALAGLGCGSSEPSEPGGAASGLSSGGSLDPTQVPESLRHLVPLAQQWGIGDDSERMESIASASAADRAALEAALAPHQAEITTWLDSFGSGPMSDETAAFMYTQLALEEMP